MSRRLVAFAVALATTLIYLPVGHAQDAALWKRVSSLSRPGEVPNIPHPLAYFLRFSPERNIDNGGSLCLGCKTKSGRTVTIDDYAVKSSQRLVDESFGRQIMEVDLTFDVKPGSVMAQLQHQFDESGISVESLTPVEWQSIVMQVAPNLYRELYFNSNPPSNSVPPVDAQIMDVRGVPLLAVRETFDRLWCAEGYWVLDRNGPSLLDFSPLQKAIANVTPPNSSAPVTGCWALSIDQLEVNAPVQEDHAKCEACGWLGTAVVDFRIENDRVIPVSSTFEPSAPQ